MDKRELFELINSKSSKTNYLVTLKDGRSAMGKCAGFAMRDELKLALSPSNSIYENTLINIDAIETIIPFDTSYDDYTNLNIKVDCKINKCFANYLNTHKRGLKESFLENLKERLDGKGIAFITINSDDYLKGKIAGIHDINLHLELDEIYLDWIFEIVTSEGIKQVALSGLKEVSIEMD